MAVSDSRRCFHSNPAACPWNLEITAAHRRRRRGPSVLIWSAMLMTDLLRQEKLQLEAAMQAEPQDASVRDRYFRILGEISRTYFGSLFACLPEIATPLLLRGASSDIWNMRQVFLHREYDVEVEEPGTILDFGAYAGYT